MIGALLGLLFGIGVVLAVTARRRPSEPARGGAARWRLRLEELLAQAGIRGVSPAQVVLACGGAMALTFLTSYAVSKSPTISAAFGLFAARAPLAALGWRRRLRRVELRDVWPEVVDNLASAVRAGLSLPEALAQLGVRGPELLRPAFAEFGEDYRATGRFGESLDRLKATLADPVGDRIVESVRMAREVGGSDLGRLLRTLAAFLREDARTRSELEARQSWTVNAARLALAAPWLLLSMLATRPEATRAYNSTAGALVLLVGGGVSLLAYRLMVRIARLPTEERVLR